MKKLLPLVFLSLLVLTGCSSKNSAPPASPQTFQQMDSPKPVKAVVFGAIVAIDSDKLLLDRGEDLGLIVCMGEFNKSLEAGQFVSLKGTLLQENLLLIENEIDMVPA